MPDAIGNSNVIVFELVVISSTPSAHELPCDKVLLDSLATINVQLYCKNTKKDKVEDAIEEEGKAILIVGIVDGHVKVAEACAIES